MLCLLLQLIHACTPKWTVTWVVLLFISCSSVVFLDSREQRWRKSKGIPHVLWDLNGICSHYCKGSVSIYFLVWFFFGTLPQGHYQEEGRGCSCGPCPGTWTPHSGRLGHPTLWWGWRGSALYQSPLRLHTNTDRIQLLNHWKFTNDQISVSSCTSDRNL